MHMSRRESGTTVGASLAAAAPATTATMAQGRFSPDEAQRGFIAHSGLTAINAIVAAGSDTVDTSVATIARWTGAAELLASRAHPSSVIEKVIEGNVHRVPTLIWSV